MTQTRLIFALIGIASFALLSYGWWRKHERLARLTGDSAAAETTAGSVPIATLKIRRLSPLGEAKEYVLDCPGAPICSASVRDGEQTVLHTAVKWEAVRSFFYATSASQFLQSPANAANDRGPATVEWAFHFNGFHREGELRDDEVASSPIPPWEAMILSRF